MKRLLSFITAAVMVSLGSAQEWMTEYQEVLDKYVTSKGVKYKKLESQGKDTLLSLSNSVGSAKVSGSKSDQLAFYINAYNIWMLKKAVDAYPVDSLISKDPGVYKREDIRVAGKQMSLDSLEHTIIRKRFGDSRIHFALNCASEGCPALHDKVFRGKTLNKTLDSLTKSFLNSKKGVNQKGDALYVSELFNWFSKDFKKDSPDGTIIGYLKKYTNVTGNPSVSYQNYSWRLNKA